ncbi:MAG: bacteriophage terminase large subunit-like protein [Caulobacteraceae bacterium]|nr:bacteriophage terminase large subunit-like protein [Caulobacteraceae bacterium]
MSRSLDLTLHPRQGEALTTPATEVLYGGAAGGGKSHLMRAAAIAWCAAIPGLQVYLFRRVREDLVRNHVEGPMGFRAILAAWTNAGLVRMTLGEIRFWNGAKIHLCHCKDAKDVYKYQGAEIHVLLIDELTHFTEGMYRFLRNRVRMVGLTIPADLAGRFPRILCGANPGNIGHAFVKRTFVDRLAPMDMARMEPAEGGMLRQFIPARLSDNPSMQRDDPGYEARLTGLGSASLVRAMRDGDWDVIEGAFFDGFDRARHVVRPFEIPGHWMRFRSGDWGSARPFSFGWWAVVSEDFAVDEGLVLPRGCLVRYREWYGARSPNVGLKLPAEQVGAGVAERERLDPKISYGVLDPAAFAQDGGPSIAERMFLGSGKTALFRRADNARVARRGAMGGWDQLRGRLAGEGEKRPMVVCFSTCLDSIRTLPALQHDVARVEDLDSDGEDHAADEWRYAAMSRPWVRVEKGAGASAPWRVMGVRLEEVLGL